MPKYIVKYDREACIGAASCTVFSKRFTIAKDGKADLEGAKETEEDFFELEIDESELEELKESARSCPVNVIKIYDEKGNKII
jgi:ferredoxin